MAKSLSESSLGRCALCNLFQFSLILLCLALIGLSGFRTELFCISLGGISQPSARDVSQAAQELAPEVQMPMMMPSVEPLPTSMEAPLRIRGAAQVPALWHNASRYLALTRAPATTAKGIPCLIHQQWKVNGKNGTRLEAWVRDSVASFQAKSKPCTHILWSDDEITTFISEQYPEILPQPLWQGLKPIQRADLFRYAVVLRLGGFYADSDVQCLKQINEWGLQVNTTLVIGYETGRHLDEATRRHVGFARNEQFEQWFFGAAPGHPVFQRCLELFRMKFDWGIENTVELTGPGLFSDAVREFLHAEAQKWGAPYPSAFQQGDKLSFPPPGYPEAGVVILSAEQVAVPGYSAPALETKKTLIRHGFKGTWKTDNAEKLSIAQRSKKGVNQPPDAWPEKPWPECVVKGVHLLGEDSALFVNLQAPLSKHSWKLTGCTDPECVHTDKFGISNDKDLSMPDACSWTCKGTEGCEFWMTGQENGKELCWLRSNDDGYKPEADSVWKAGKRSCAQAPKGL